MVTMMMMMMMMNLPDETRPTQEQTNKKRRVRCARPDQTRYPNAMLLYKGASQKKIQMQAEMLQIQIPDKEKSEVKTK